MAFRLTRGKLMRQVKAEGREVGGGMRGGEVGCSPALEKSHLPDEFSSSNSTRLELPRVAKLSFSPPSARGSSSSSVPEH